MQFFRKEIGLIFFFAFLTTAFNQVVAQTALCGPTTPTFTVNLTGQPNGYYMSPSVVREDTCCGSTGPDKCIQFIVTLDPAAVGLIFTVCDGAVPPGALYYQVNCGTPQQVGTGICLSPPYPDTITFCKPGNNQNQYCIQSISPPSAVSLSKNCSALMWTYGFDDPSIVWTSISPGPPGSYNAYLSCVSGCDSTWVTPQPGYPSYVDYKVCGTVTGGCNIKSCDTVRVNFPLPLTLTVSATNVSCYGGNNGTATAGSGGGIPSYSYSWSPSGGTSSTAVGLFAGNYTCTITDAVGCTKTATVTILQPTQVIATYTSTFATCSQSNGTATTNPSGGTPTYTYQWLNGQTTPTATGLAPGIYQVTIGDENGCTLTASVPVSNVLPIVTISSTTVTCNGGLNGSGTSLASGGIPPYVYQWSNGQTTSTATGLSAGTYTVTTASFGCVHYDLVTIPEPTALTVTIIAQNNVTCNGGNNGYVNINYGGGTPGYSYQWSSGQTTASISGLIAGNYTLTVSDVNGCTASNSIAITEPPLLSLTISSQTNVLCNGDNTGFASLTVSGGTPLYAYQWSNGQTTAEGKELIAGSYTCVASDANGCTVIGMFIITEPPAIVVSIPLSPGICSGQNATFNGLVQGGTPGYSYAWSPAGGNASTAIVSPSSNTTYTLTITDVNGCTKEAIQSLTVNPQPIAVFSVPTSCMNNITLFNNQTTGGGTIWSWNFGEPASGSNNISTNQNPSHTYGNAGAFIVTLIASNPYGCSDTIVQVVNVSPLPIVGFTASTVCFGNTTTFNNSSSIATGNINSWTWNFGDPNSGPDNISASLDPTHIFSSSGTYNVILTATSDSGCQSSTTQPVLVYALPTASFVTTIACTNNPINFANASTLATQWLWDFGNLGGTSIQQNPSHSYPSQGSYSVTLIVTSAGGCKDTTSQTIQVAISPVPDFSPDSACVDFPISFIDLTVAPGGSVVKWFWDFGDGSVPDTVQNPLHAYGSAGTYSVTLTVTASNGCVLSISKTVVVFPRPSASFTYSPENCINLGDKVELTDHSFSDITSWLWLFGDSSMVSYLPSPTHVYNDTGNFVITLIVQDHHGCRDTTLQSICVDEWTFYIPNAFSPNGNGNNDFFFGQGIGIVEYEIWIFDRWGNTIFHCAVNDLPQSTLCRWDGKVMGDMSNMVVQEDVYVWKARMKNFRNDIHSYVGTVTVVR